MNPIELEFYGIFHNELGYAVHSRAIARFLAKNGFKLRLIPYNYTRPLPQADLEPLRHTKLERRYPIIRLVCLPPHPVYQRNRYTILLTMMETASLHPGVISRLRTADEVWTPNQHNLKQFRAALPKKIPVLYMPEGTDIKLYCPKGSVLDIRGNAHFLAVSVFNWQWRKGPDILIRAWLSAFTAADRARLVMLTRVPTLSKRESRQIIIAEINKAISELCIDDPPEIIIADDYLPTEDMPKFYRAADVFVLPTRGEGWCLPALDAMACGTPPVITNCTGQAAYATSSNSVLLKPGKPLPFVPEKVRLMNFFDDQTFYNPSYQELAKKLKRIYNNRVFLLKLSRRGAADTALKWDWNVSLKPIAERLRKVAQIVEKRRAQYS